MLSFSIPFSYDGDDAARVRLGLRELYYDTLIGHQPSLRLAKEQLGAEHLMLGSDYRLGMAPLEESLRFLADADLTEDEREQVMGGNAARVLGLSVPSSKMAHI